MKRLRWRVTSGLELSSLLVEATLHESAAVGDATLYRISQEEAERVAISLPDGQVLVIEPDLVQWTRRRRQESAPAARAAPPEKPRRKA